MKKVKSLTENQERIVVFMDIYKCRSEYEFYEKFASSVIQATSTKMDQMVQTAKEFIMSITPRITYSPDPGTEYTLSLGITPKMNTPEEILDLPERIALKKGIQMVVCIDEFQQIGEMPDSLTVQKTIRSVWQHHRNVCYCLFGSKQHLMNNLFYSRKMPFYQFGDMFFLKKIPTEKWVPFITSRFKDAGKQISEKLAERICQTVDNYSSYVQQLAWNVFVVSDSIVTEQSFQEGMEATFAQVTPFFVELTANLTTYQMNLLRAICSGFHEDFGKKDVTSHYDLGSRSNLVKLKKALIEREIIEQTEDGLFISDPLFERWFKQEMA